jgi:hypothetical protein
MAETLGARLEGRDARRFAGRAAELSTLTGLLVGEPSVSVVLVHGPGGIGKSTLLREFGRRAGALGWSVCRVDCRELDPVPDALADAVEPARRTDRPLVLVDEFDAVYAMGRRLRTDVLADLPAQAVVVIASRRAPELAWFQDGWEHLTMALELGPLAPADARALLIGRGVHDAERAARIALWAGDSPLALALAADADAASVDFEPGAAGNESVVDGLVRVLVAAEAEPERQSVLGLASIARVTTAEMLADVLPGRDPREEMRWLAGRTFVEPRGDGIALHALTGRAVRADLGRRDPAHERELRRRIADHLHRRAVQGRLALTVDLAHLTEDPVIRWGYGWDGSDRYRVDDVGPGDASSVSRALASRGNGNWWAAGAQRWFAEAPERIFIVRDAGDRLCGYATAMTPATAPAFAREDAVVGRWLAHADATGEPAVLWRDSVDFTGDAGAPVQAMLGLAGVLRSGLENPRYAYLPVDPRMPSALAFARALGATHLTELDGRGRATAVQCHRVDYGVGGLLGAQRDVIYRELGLEPPAAQAPPVSFAAVRDALRDLRVPHRLARNPLARGSGAEQRAASVRDLLAGGVDDAFGDTADERLLRAVLVRGYLEPAASHELAADELHLSRSAYFRRLRSATQRLAEHLSG